jgi:hemerythrin
VGEVTYESFALFLFEWFTLHTTIEDKKIAEFISKNHGAT